VGATNSIRSIDKRRSGRVITEAGCLILYRRNIGY
jgi:hypothetical protein